MPFGSSYGRHLSGAPAAGASPEHWRGRLNRRRRNLAPAIGVVRRGALALLDLARDRQCSIGISPVSVVRFRPVPHAAGTAG